jgi:hypothetical protein
MSATEHWHTNVAGLDHAMAQQGQMPPTMLQKKGKKKGSYPFFLVRVSLKSL